MRYYSKASEESESSLIAADGEDVYDLTSARPELSRFTDLARIASVMGTTLDGVASQHLTESRHLDALPSDVATPVTADEVWAAGVTYELSEEARESESDRPDIYLDVYDAERPELFFKATPSRTVGPNASVGIRSDSGWDVPEPELGVVLYRGEVVGYTVGNDMSSRSIEGQNPLYLPQAKVYDRCCAIGPCVASTDTTGDPQNLDFRMTIRRGGEEVYTERSNTAEMARNIDDLVDHLRRHDRLPETTVLLTGTPLVPPDEFTLAAGDTVSIEIENIGTLENTVTVV